MTFPKHEPSMEIKSMEIVKQNPPEVKRKPGRPKK